MPGTVMGEAMAASTKRASTMETSELRALGLLSCQGETERLARGLCARERERAARFHFRADYERYVAARAALGLQLGAFLGCDPKSLSFQYTSHDKPIIENCGIEFNLSPAVDGRSAEICGLCGRCNSALCGFGPHSSGDEGASER
jgi:hypothetical protein